MCFLCLRKGNTVRDCREIFSCFKCKHHVAIFEFKPDNGGRTNPTGRVTNVSVNFSCDGNDTLLQTARVRVSPTNERKCENMRILYDCGSQHFYISPAARRLLELQTANTQHLNSKVSGGSERGKKLDCVQFAVEEVTSSQNVYVNSYMSEI